MSQAIQPALSRYNPIYSKNFEKEATQLKRKTFCYQLAEKVTMVAIAAIMATVLAISFGAGAAIAGLSTGAFVGVLCTIPLSLMMSSFRQKALEFSGQRDMAVRMATKYRELSTWTDQQIINQLATMKIQPQQLPWNMMREINPQNPYRALLPALTRYVILDEERIAGHAKVREGLGYVPQNQGNDAQSTTLLARRKGWQRLEGHEVFASAEAALMIQAILNPTIQASSMTTFGTYRHKEFDERTFDRLLNNNDDYFVPNQQGPSIQFESLVELDRNNILTAKHPADLRPMFFPIFTANA